MTDYVFAYGSLVEQPGGEPKPQLAELRGHRRTWGVAMDNARDLPGYKFYVDAASGGRPRVHVAFVDLRPDPQSSVNGVLVPADGEGLAALDVRERNYGRREVTAGLERAAPGRVWAYFGTAAARGRCAEARAAGTLVAGREYYDRVRAGFARLGATELRRFDATTDAPGVPLMDLTRVDLP